MILKRVKLPYSPTLERSIRPIRRKQIALSCCKAAAFVGYILLLKDANTTMAIGLSLFYWSSVLKEEL